MAALGLPALLPPGCLAARPRAVAVPKVAAAANGEWPPAPPAVAQVQDRSVELGHRSLQRWGLDERCPLVRGSNYQGWASARVFGAGRGTTRKPRRLPGFSFLYPARRSISPPARPSPHPPRYARDDAASPILDVMVGFLRILVGAYSTSESRPQRSWSWRATHTSFVRSIVSRTNERPPLRLPGAIFMPRSISSKKRRTSASFAALSPGIPRRVRARHRSYAALLWYTSIRTRTSPRSKAVRSTPGGGSRAGTLEPSPDFPPPNLVPEKCHDGLMLRPDRRWLWHLCES